MGVQVIEAEVVVIGGGAASLAAAIAARDAGAQDVLVLERDEELGGILQQCIHDGFGVFQFGEHLTGPSYMQRFIDRLEATDIRVLLNTMALELSPRRWLYAASPRGLLQVRAGAIVMATGCRERTRNQIWLPGTRPAGIYTAGVVQRYINLEGLLPGSKAVILGSGDVGLIVARRLTLEGVQVEGVYEINDSPGALIRNVVQCLEDYDIPLYLSHQALSVTGENRVQGVELARISPPDGEVISGTERFVPCDTLILSVGLIPENELLLEAQAEVDYNTGGPRVDDRLQTSIPGVFSAGNSAVVFDLVDWASASGSIAGREAARYTREGMPWEDLVAVTPGPGVASVFPQQVRRLALQEGDGVTLYVRSAAILQNARVALCDGERVVQQVQEAVVRPAEMITLAVPPNGSGPVPNGELTLSITGDPA